MDVVKWTRHSAADGVDYDNLFDCLVYFETKAINIWYDGRKAVRSAQGPDAKLAAVNDALQKLNAEVFCKALALADGVDPQAPAGGATAYYSCKSGSPVMPRGLISETDAKTLHQQWNTELRNWRDGCADGDATSGKMHSLGMGGCKKANSPVGMAYPPRNAADICLNPQQFNVKAAKLENWRQTISKSYLQPEVSTPTEVGLPAHEVATNEEIPEVSTSTEVEPVPPIEPEPTSGSVPDVKQSS